MDLTSQPTQTTTTPINNNNGTAATTTTTNSFTKSPDTIKIQPLKSLTLMNGVLKRHHTHNQSHHGGTQAVTYKECLRNHAATIGGHALDGCGEFMPSPTATASDPTSLKCAACGCHRNFHRREPEDSFSPPPPPPSSRIEYQSHHRHHPPPPPAQPRSPNSSSPPPISSAYAPHMLLALSSHGVPGLPENFNANNVNVSAPSFSSTRKRFRTKFTQDQKERMFEFAEKLNWKMQKRDEDLIKEFCNEVKVDKGVLKVWMHNNKNTFNKRLETNKGFANECPNINYNVDIEDGRQNNSNSDDMMNHHHHHQQDFKIDIGGGVRHGTNGSSSTS